MKDIINYLADNWPCLLFFAMVFGILIWMAIVEDRQIAKGKCPRCGGDITETIATSRYLIEYKCKCGFTHVELKNGK